MLFSLAPICAKLILMARSFKARTNIQGASLEFGTQLQGATLAYANLQGADLGLAQLQGASLDSAQLQGASLLGAQLQGAALDEAQLQGAYLFGANLQGASLAGAQLRGAWLVWAQLQGATLERAELAGAALDNAFVWRARFSLESLEAFEHQKIVWDSKYWKGLGLSEKNLGPGLEPWTEASYLALKNLIEAEVATPHSVIEEVYVQVMAEQSSNFRPPAAAGRDAALKRIEILDPNKAFQFEADVPKWKKKIEAKAVRDDDYEKALVRKLKALVCSGDADAVYVVRGLLKQGSGVITNAGARAPGLVEAILKPECPVSAALTDTDKADLKRIAKEASGAH
jgi:Pentapeptide repeats (8 copies)